MPLWLLQHAWHLRFSSWACMCYLPVDSLQLCCVDSWVSWFLLFLHLKLSAMSSLSSCAMPSVSAFRCVSFVIWISLSMIVFLVSLRFIQGSLLFSTTLPCKQTASTLDFHREDMTWWLAQNPLRMEFKKKMFDLGSPLDSAYNGWYLLFGGKRWLV